MNLIYFADGPWAQTGLDKMMLAGYTIRRIYLRHNNPDRLLKEKAERYGIEVNVCPDVNAPEEVASIKKRNADLGVSLSFNQIIKDELLNSFPKGMINVHAGKLPLYRGRNVLNWALINGEKEIGVTCHYIDIGIDSGDIILQRTFPVNGEDDYGSILEKAYNLCSDVLVESLGLIVQNKVERKPQLPGGAYYVGRMDGDEYIDWGWSSEQIFNFVRAITTPGPCARSWVWRDGRYFQVIVRKVELVEGAPVYQCINGAVTGKTKDGYPMIKTKDTAIIMTDYEIEDEDKSIKLKTGDRLGINLNLVMKNLMGALNHERLLKPIDL